MSVHELLLSDAKETRDDEVDVDGCRNRDVDDRKDQGEDLLHLLHLRIRLLRGWVTTGELLHLKVLQPYRQENHQNVRRLAAPAQTVRLYRVREVDAESAQRAVGVDDRLIQPARMRNVERVQLAGRGLMGETFDRPVQDQEHRHLQEKRKTAACRARVVLLVERHHLFIQRLTCL